MSMHTEGPWAVVNGVIRANDGQSVASVHLPRMNDETMLDGESWLDMRTRTQPERAAIGAEMSANARLIAAAPDLLAALVKAEAQIIGLYRASAPHANDGDGNRFADADPTLAEIRAAIAKATA